MADARGSKACPSCCCRQQGAHKGWATQCPGKHARRESSTFCLEQHVLDFKVTPLAQVVKLADQTTGSPLPTANGITRTPTSGKQENMVKVEQDDSRSDTNSGLPEPKKPLVYSSKVLLPLHPKIDGVCPGATIVGQSSTLGSVTIVCRKKPRLPSRSYWPLWGPLRAQIGKTLCASSSTIPGAAVPQPWHWWSWPAWACGWGCSARPQDTDPSCHWGRT